MSRDDGVMFYNNERSQDDHRLRIPRSAIIIEKGKNTESVIIRILAFFFCFLYFYILIAVIRMLARIVVEVEVEEDQEKLLFIWDLFDSRGVIDFPSLLVYPEYN